jgi:type I restriction enzyme S subunit
MKKAALKDVAPAKAARVSFSPKDAVWQLNLDQVESQSGRILSKVTGLASAAGSSTQAFDTGNVLYSKLRPYLNKVVCPDSPGIATTELVPLRPDPKQLDRQYLTYYLRSPEFVTWISNEVAGAKMPRVTMKVFWDHEIPLPPLAEQKRIAGILDAADALRAKRREALAQLDALLQSSFLTLFGDPVSNPMGWDVALLGKTAKRITKGQSPNWQGFNYQDSGALFVTSENVRDGHLDISKPKFVPLEFNEKLKGSQLRLGDLLINLVGASIGRSCLFSGYLGPANVNQAVGIVSIDDPVLTNYIAQLLQTQQGQTLLTGRIVEAARANVSLTNLRELPIPTPPLPLQQKFAGFVESIERQKTTQRAHLAELDALFAALQHRAFRGEL